MLFNSAEFIFAFLPVVLVGYFLLGKRSRRYAVAWLVAASLFFYAWWHPGDAPILVASVVFNYVMGLLIAKSRGPWRGRFTALAIATNLTVLAYYKYANFFEHSALSYFGVHLFDNPIRLPIGISFFTFTQIAYLVDSYKRKADEPDFLSYFLFVTYFPHLIAGPILHHAEMMPQFRSGASVRPSRDHINVGVTVFVIGLFKKVVIADSISSYANVVFDSISSGQRPDFFDSWAAAIAYTFQIYFDFSGYCDMAIGISILFNIKLPLNFNSPYKADSLIEFWRRWHMTLSRFLRDYLYIPLGGGRRGKARRYLNLFVTMLLGGLWHGAGFTFILWGAFHGAGLAINHAWREVFPAKPGARTARLPRILSTGSTLLFVIVGWVFFRAASLADAFAVLRGMVFLNGIAVPAFLTKAVPLARKFGVPLLADAPTAFDGNFLTSAIILGAVVLFAPNVAQIMARQRPMLDEMAPVARGSWSANGFWAVAIGVGAAACLVIMAGAQKSQFLYFQF